MTEEGGGRIIRKLIIIIWSKGILSCLKTEPFQLAMDSEGFVTQGKWQTSALAIYPSASHIKGQGKRVTEGSTLLRRRCYKKNVFATTKTQ